MVFATNVKTTSKAVVSKQGRLPVKPVIGTGKSGSGVPARIGANAIVTKAR